MTFSFLSFLNVFALVCAVSAAAAGNRDSAFLVPRQGASSSISSTSMTTSTLHPGPSDAAAILYPAIYDTNLTDVHNLDPQSALQVYYEEPGEGTNAAIVAFQDLKHPTVVLEHSSYITNVTCNSGKVKIQFSARAMALYAYNSWNTNISSGIIFVTNHPTCSDAYPAERGWILVSTVRKNGASVECDYVDVLAQDIIKSVGIYFGQTPGGVSSVPSSQLGPSQSSLKSTGGLGTFASPSTTTKSSSTSSKMSSSFSTTKATTSVTSSTSVSIDSSKTTSTSRTLTSPASSSTMSGSTSSKSMSVSSSHSSLPSSSMLSTTGTTHALTTTASSTTSSSHQISSGISSLTSLSSILPVSSSTKPSSVSSSSKSASTTLPLTISTTSTHSSTSSSSSKSVSPSSSTTIKSTSSSSSTAKSSTKSTSIQVSSMTNSVASTSSLSASATPQPFGTIADFDTALDDSIGYLNSSAPGFWAQLLPGIPPSQIVNIGTPASLSKRSIGRRDWNLPSIASILTQALPGPVALSLTTVQAVFQSASDSIDAAVSAAIGIVIATLNHFSPFALGPFPFSAGPNNTATTDFGPGVQLASKSGTFKGAPGTLSAYCIGCGATGSFSITGSILFDATEGITQAVFDITGNIHAQIEIAVIATIAASAQQEKNLITQGLPDLTIPGFLVLGPAIALDVGATVSVEALGGLAAGYQLNWPAITAHFDVLNDVYTASGLDPVGTPIADAELNITSTASLYGLISLTFGIDVMGGKYKANVGLVDKAEIDAFAEVIVYTDYQISQMADGTVVCVGENFTLGLTDSAYADIVWGGVGNKSISTKTYPLTTLPGPTFTTCFGSLSTIHHSSTTSSSSSTPSPTPTTYPSGQCDPAPLRDGYCCVLPPNLEDATPAYTAWQNCLTASQQDWYRKISLTCSPRNATTASIKACFTAANAAIQPLFKCVDPPPNTAPTDEYYLCHADNLYIISEINMLSYYVMWGKRALGERQSSFVDVVGHGARNATTMMAWTDDGNLVASQNGTSFATLNGYLVGDTNSRLLHLYSDTMVLSGVSRLRLASVDKMPVGSVLVALAPMDIGLASPALVAFTSSGAHYYIVTCTITGQLPKLFLARTVAGGIAQLMDPGLEASLTGGIVEECGLLPWSI